MVVYQRLPQVSKVKIGLTTKSNFQKINLKNCVEIKKKGELKKNNDQDGLHF